MPCARFFLLTTPGSLEEKECSSINARLRRGDDFQRSAIESILCQGEVRESRVSSETDRVLDTRKKKKRGDFRQRLKKKTETKQTWKQKIELT